MQNLVQHVYLVLQEITSIHQQKHVNHVQRENTMNLKLLKLVAVVVHKVNILKEMLIYARAISFFYSSHSTKNE